MLKPEDIKKERKRFTEDNLSADNDSGMIIYDNKFSELKQVESKPYTPNALQMQHIQENVCTHFGTNMDILQNKFDENTWNAYYEGKIEPFAIQLSLVMTNMTFTKREIAQGNAIVFSANRSRSFLMSSGFSIFATFARKRIFAEFFTALIIPSFWVCICLQMGSTALLSLSEWGL